MNSAQTSDVPSLAARLEKIERENRILKLSGLIFVLTVGVVLAMAQAPAKRTLEATEFVLKDSTGATRATLGIVRNEPMLTLIDASGQTRTNLGTGSIDFEDSNGTRRVLLGSSSGIIYKLVNGSAQMLDQGPGLIFSAGSDNHVMAELAGLSHGGAISLYGETQSSTNSREQVVLESSADGPSLTLSDAQGFQTVVGSTSLRTPSTGVSSRTSAASVVLFDQDGKSIWSAP